jgi:hypothetical protein
MGMQRDWRRKRQLQLLAERGKDVALGDEAEIDEDLADLLTAFALEFEGFFEVFGGDQLPGQQNFAEAH